MSNIKQLRAELKIATSKFYKLKSKKAIEKQRDVIREIEAKLHDTLLTGISSYMGMRHSAVVLMDGTDVIAKSEFGTINLYAQNDVESKSWYESTCCVSFKKGDIVTFEILHPSVSYGQLSWFAGNIEGGRFDQEMYDRLCKQDNLAFFKTPDGSRTGLFK